MNSTYIEVLPNSSTVTPGGWGPWRTSPKTLGPLGYSERTHTRRVTETSTTHTVTETCTRVVKGIVADYIVPDYFYWRTATTTTPWRQSVVSYSESETDWTLFDPPTALFPWRAAAGPIVPQGDRIRMQTSWLRRVADVATYEAFLDGDSYDGRYVNTGVLRVGNHTFDLDVELVDGTHRLYQIAFSVVRPFIVSFAAPEHDVPISLDPAALTPNGTSLGLTVENRTTRDLTLNAFVIDVPHGWKAGFIDDPRLLLAGGQRASLTLQVEMMNEFGLDGGAYVPIAVGVTVGFSTRRALRRRDPGMSVAVCNLHPQIDPAELQAVLASNEEARLNRLPKFSG